MVKGAVYVHRYYIIFDENFNWLLFFVQGIYCLNKEKQPMHFSLWEIVLVQKLRKTHVHWTLIASWLLYRINRFASYILYDNEIYLVLQIAGSFVIKNYIGYMIVNNNMLLLMILRYILYTYFTWWWTITWVNIYD